MAFCASGLAPVDDSAAIAAPTCFWTALTAAPPAATPSEAPLTQQAADEQQRLSREALRGLLEDALEELHLVGLPLIKIMSRARTLIEGAAAATCGDCGSLHQTLYPRRVSPRRASQITSAAGLARGPRAAAVSTSCRV